MQSTNWKDVAELVGIAAIVASLIFVGLEMRQTRSIALAETYQTRTDSEMFVISYMNQPDLRRVWMKVVNDESLTAEDEWLLSSAYSMRLAYLENLHFQMESGMLTRELWVGNLIGLTQFFLDPTFAEWWEFGRDTYRPSFSREIDRFIENNGRDE